MSLTEKDLVPKEYVKVLEEREKQLEAREKQLEEREKRVKRLVAIQNEITKILDMNDKLMKIADEVVCEIGSGSCIELHICDIAMEYTAIHRNVTDLLIEALLDERIKS